MQLLTLIALFSLKMVVSLNEIVRGEKPRKQFFDQIMDVVSFLGGEGADVQ